MVHSVTCGVNPLPPDPQTTLGSPPRSVAWLLLAASAAAVLLTGLVMTALAIGRVGPPMRGVPPAYWSALAAAAALTLASLALRALRWVFLLRRRDVRIPIRDAYVGYLAGLSLLLAPLLLGEMLVRAYVHRVRARVPPAETLLVNLWERLFDLIALAVIAGLGWLLLRPDLLTSIGLAAVIAGVAMAAARRPSFGTWATAILTSVVAWLLPGVGLWLLANATAPSITLMDAQSAYARSSLVGGITLAPGGILVTGRQLLVDLQRAGLTAADAVAVVVGIRVATVGLSTALGVVMLLVHVRTTRVADLKVRATGHQRAYVARTSRSATGADQSTYVARTFRSATGADQSTYVARTFRSATATEAHFDDIAEVYDVQIPAARRDALITTKTSLMHEVLASHGTGTRGLDVGCGQGWYVERMRSLGFDVEGIDSSAAQLQAAERHLGAPGLTRLGSALAIPAADASYDFVYTINVLHHLPSVADQRAALREIARVLRPGGLLFVHEINTRNVLFRFYMGYVFPSLNCIDEGVERWLLPDRLDRYTDMRVIDVRYFTFLPDFLPPAVVRWLAPIEGWLERSRLAPYSAHYMAVLQVS